MKDNIKHLSIVSGIAGIVSAGFAYCVCAALLPEDRVIPNAAMATFSMFIGGAAALKDNFAGPSIGLNALYIIMYVVPFVTLGAGTLHLLGFIF